MKRDCLREYIDAVRVRISVLERILSGDLKDADFIQKVAPDLAAPGLPALFECMSVELADNLCCMPRESMHEIVNYYWGNLHPLMVGYLDRVPEVIRRVQDMGATNAVNDMIKVAEAINENTARLGEIDGIIEQYYNPEELPTINNTERERQVFGRAIKHGYMVREGDGYKWLKSTAQAAYMIERVYCPTNTERVPEKAVNRLLGISRVDSAITHLHDAKKPKQKWHDKINSDLFE